MKWPSLKKNSFHLLRNNRGILTVDFLFAMAVSGVMCVLMFAFSSTLALIEISQYIAFSTARVQAAGHLTQAKQFNQARDKFASFIDPKAYPGLAPLLLNGWFEVDQKSVQIRGGGSASTASGSGDFSQEYGYENNSLPQIGVRFIFKAPVLKFNIPLVGKVGEENDFGTYITGMIFREPSSEECSSQMTEDIRFKAVQGLDGRYQSIYSSGMYGGRHTPKADSYFAMEDNGC